LNKLDNILFELIQVAIGTRRELTQSLSADEWAQLRLEFKKQALLGIGYVGVTKLPAGQTPPIQVLAQWVHNAEKIRKKNERITGECVSLCEQLAHDGLWACILKGQGNLINYPEGLRDYRTPGDIDVWCAPIDKIEIAEGNDSGARYVSYRGERAVIEYALMQARLADKQDSEVRYIHVELPNIWPVDVEIHHKPSFLFSPLKNRRLQKWFKDHLFVNQKAVLNGSIIPIPSPSFNAIYQLSHIYRHLFDEGIGLRQLLDYYFVLRALHIEQVEHSDRTQSMAMWAHSTYSGQASGLGRSVLSNMQIIYHLKRFGLSKFASAVMFVLQEAFAMPNVYLICEPNEKEGKWLLNEIMMGGNFGQYDERIERVSKSFMGFRVSGGSLHAWEKTKHNMRMLNHYPVEVMWEPVFRLYHWLWRRFEWWK